MGSPWEQSHFLGYWVLTGRAGTEESFNISPVVSVRSWPYSNLGNYINPMQTALSGCLGGSGEEWRVGSHQTPSASLLGSQQTWFLICHTHYDAHPVTLSMQGGFICLRMLGRV